MKVRNIFINILLSAGLIAPVFSYADCNWGDGTSTPESVFAQSCAQSGGVAHSCQCDAASSGSSNNSATSSGGGYTPQQQMLLNGMQMMVPIGQQAVHDFLYGNPEQEARRAQEAAIRAAEEKRIAEEKARREEETKQRLLGDSSDPNALSLKDVEQSSDLHIITDDQEEDKNANSSQSAVSNTSADHSLTVGGLQLLTEDEVTSGEGIMPTNNPRPKIINEPRAVVKEAESKSSQQANTSPDVPQAQHDNAKNHQRIDAFTVGFDHSSHCISQNSGPTCGSLSGEDWEICLADYKKGYEVGKSSCENK